MGDTCGEPAASESSSSQTPADDLQCTICLSSEFAQECRVNGCNHSFCFSCISEWVCQSLRPSCPMCRHDIENIFYDFSERKAKKEIGIKEYRSSQMSISSADREQLLGERRLVVRNLMHSYKLLTLLASEIAEWDQSNVEEAIKKELQTLEETVSCHILSAEKSLIDLRTEMVRKNKSLVFNTLSFRRIIYTNKIKVKYPDRKGPKLQPEDISKNPDRFRSIIINFLLSEFEAIPYQNQPKVAGHKWRTKFLGGTIDLAQKQRYADDIYELMLSQPTGSQNFQKDLGSILSPVSHAHIQFLDDHLDAIIATEKSSIEEFYQEVYYDSIYNSYPNSFFDYNAMLNMRDDPQSRFEALFSQLQQIGPFDILDTHGPPRFYRQLSNTDRTDRATNNDGDSDRSSSPEERTPTPMPEDQFIFNRALMAPIHDTNFVYRHTVGRFPIDRLPSRAQPAHQFPQVRTAEPSRTTHSEHASRSHMTLRSSTRRDREQDPSSEQTEEVSSSHFSEPRPPRVGRRREVQDLENSSVTLSRMLQRPPPSQPMSLGQFFSFLPESGTRLTGPVYQPTAQSNRNETRSDHIDGPTMRGIARRLRLEAMGSDPERHNAIEAYMASDSNVYHRRHDLRRRSRSPGPAPPALTVPPDTQIDVESVEQIAAAINQEDADNGLDFISIAHRTRSARRAAGGGTLPGAPPPKRPAPSRRGRR